MTHSVRRGLPRVGRLHAREVDRIAHQEASVERFLELSDATWQQVGWLFGLGKGRSRWLRPMCLRR